MKSKKFPHFEPELKKLFTTSDMKIFGFAVKGDAEYLEWACFRYNISPFDFTCYDVQDVMKYYSANRQKLEKLTKAFKTFCGNEEFVKLTPHFSQDDAYMTMMVFKSMCQNLEMSVDEVISLCPTSKMQALELYQSPSTQEQLIRENPELKLTHGKKRPGQVVWGEFYRSHLPLLEKV